MITGGVRGGQPHTGRRGSSSVEAFSARDSTSAPIAGTCYEPCQAKDKRTRALLDRNLARDNRLRVLQARS